MSDTGDVVQCQHYLEGLHRKVNYEAPKASAGMIEKSVGFVSNSLALLGTG